MEQLLKFTHSHSIQKKCIIKQWKIFINNTVYVLKYEQQQLKNTSETKSASFYLKNICDEKTNIIIYNIDKWVNENIIDIEKSEANYQKCLKLTEYINEHIGNKTYKSALEIAWSIPEYLRLSIKFYEIMPNNEPYILLNYKEKDIFLSEYKLKKFIQNNKKIIIQKKDKSLSPLIKKYNLATNIFIKRTIRQRYESQACKPFLEKYAWEKTN